MVLGGAVSMPSTASATWSIAAVDARTQEVGVAVASCVEAPFGSTVLPQVAGLAPGVGALAAQALFSQARRDDALGFLAAGMSPQEVIDMTNALDGQPQSRQYGVVVLSGESAGFTGDNAQDWAGHQPSLGVTVQGNILYGPDVVGDALAAFDAVPRECPWTLADRLMVALEAGSAQGGDNRCSKEQSALAAVLQVARPGDAKGAFYLDLRVPSQADGGDNPVSLLRAEYDQWRLEHPADEAACGGGSSSSGGDDTGGTATGSADTTTGAPPAGEGSGGEDDPPAPSASSSSTTDSPAADSGGGESGCGCRVSGGSGAWATGLLLLVWGVRRRRRRAATVRAS
jgi:MYXO-CTERM domain-containing protein